MYSATAIPHEVQDEKDGAYEMYDFSKTQSEETKCVN